MRGRIFILFLLTLAGTAFTPVKRTFEETQLGFQRVRQAYDNKEEFINRRCASMGIPSSFGNMFIRVFKEEKLMEIWVQRPDKKYVRFNRFSIFSSSGRLGPKRMQGDFQVPEGFYHIIDFNPYSNYYLSLGISYPNQSDMILSSAAKKGGEIYIHGSDVSIGCMAMGDSNIEDIYICAVKARNQGQQRIPVQIYPFRPTPTNVTAHSEIKDYQQHKKLWWNLAEGYNFFERYNRLPEVTVNSTGYYQFSDPDLAQAK